MMGRGPSRNGATPVPAPFGHETTASRAVARRLDSKSRRYRPAARRPPARAARRPETTAHAVRHGAPRGKVSVRGAGIVEPPQPNGVQGHAGGPLMTMTSSSLAGPMSTMTAGESPDHAPSRAAAHPGRRGNG